MDSVKPVPAPNIGGLVRNFTKALRFHGGSGIAPEDKVRKKFKDDDHGEKARKKASMEALLARLFASISSVKAAYAQLQISQSPYDADGIQKADELLVSELKNLSELKLIYLKKQIDPSPQVTQLLAEIQEQQSLLKTYEIMGRKFESQIMLKDSDISSMRERLDETDRQNRFLEKRLKQSGSLLHLDDLYISGLNPNHFITVLKHVVKSIQSFVKVMVNQMKLSGWDIAGAGNAIQPGVVYSKPSHVCFAFESFVCREMFDGFQCPDFSVPNESRSKHKRKQQQHFFNEFMELKSISSKEFLTRNPKSKFGKFCKFKYLQLIHPKMEISFFGNLIQRNNVNSGGYPDTEFFASFSEMAMRVWFLHCLAFSFEPEASIFEMRKGCRFSEVYMESVVEDAFFTSNGTLIVDPRVGFTVVPGFKIGKTTIQSQVYPSPG